jgi:hypothetical protein
VLFVQSFLLRTRKNEVKAVRVHKERGSSLGDYTVSLKSDIMYIKRLKANRGNTGQDAKRLTLTTQVSGDIAFSQLRVGVLDQHMLSMHAQF